MTQELPPPPNDQQGLTIPIPQLQGLAKMWVQYRPIIGIGARLAKQKIPADLDAILTAVAGGDPNAIATLQHKAMGEEGPDGMMQVPEPRIGERVLAKDEAALAWQLVRVNGLSYRQARDVMAERYDINVSHATVKNYVDEMDAEMQDDRDLRRAGAYKTLCFFMVTSVGMFLLGHFLRF